AGLHAARDGDDLGGGALLLQPHRFFDRDLVERIHGHLDVRGLDPAADALYGNQDFHREIIARPWRGTAAPRGYPAPPPRGRRAGRRETPARRARPPCRAPRPPPLRARRSRRRRSAAPP